MEFIQKIDVVVIGRTTFDQVIRFDPWPWRGRRVLVLTSRPLPAEVPEGVCACLDGLEKLIARLKTEELNRDIWIMGGPKMIHSFHVSGSLDRIEITLLPVLFGVGVPLIAAATGPVALQLEHQQTFPDGVLRLVYSPEKAPPALSRMDARE
jgi:dihydrofolate reductase